MNTPMTRLIPFFRLNKIVTVFFASVLMVVAETHTVPTTGVAATLEYSVVNNEVIIMDCNGDVSGELVIPSAIEGKNVTSIGELAFYLCTSLTSVTIPDGVISIGWGVFFGCSSLTSVRIPDSVTSIGLAAFEHTLIAYDHEADNLKYLLSENGLNAFLVDSSGASGDVVIPSTVNGGTVRSFDAFRGRLNITSVTIPDSVTSIGERVFSRCLDLTSVTIPDSVTSIGERAFSGCWSLTSVIFEGAAPTVSSFPFSGFAEGAKAIVQPVHEESFGGAEFLWNGLIVELAELQITRSGFVNVETFFIELKPPGLGYRVMSSPTLDFRNAVNVTPTLEPISATDNRFEFPANGSRNFYRLEAASP